ncbi:MAG TPA: efflux RND transporter periplasmic adaptor subunit [Bacteroidia bacterium]
MKNISFYILMSLTVLSCGKKTEETKPVKKDVIESVFATGVLEANNTYSLTAKTDGYLISVNFSEGDIIQQSQLLATVENKESIFNEQSSTALFEIAQSNLNKNAPAIAQAKNALQLAKQKLQVDSLNFDRYKKLYEQKTVSTVDYENSMIQYNTSKSNYLTAVESYKLAQQQAEQQYISSQMSKRVNDIVSGNNQIKAVIGGRVYKKLKQTGDYVRTGDVIATIGDANYLYAKVSIDESNISKIKVGQEATIQLNTLKNKTYKGKVAEIYPSFDEATQSFYCKVVFTDSLDFRITGTQLQVNINIGKSSEALLIPRYFLEYDGTVKVKGKEEPVKVEAGFISNKWVSITKGLKGNETLVTENPPKKDNNSGEGLQMQ